MSRMQLPLLDADRLRQRMVEYDFELLDQVGSTSDRLGHDFRHRYVVLAEQQNQGRGRRGRRWLSPPGAGIWLSWGYRFEAGLGRMGALSVAIGCTVADSLADRVPGIALKWPNDLVVSSRKLGGVLIELKGGVGGPTRAVIGVGINVCFDRSPSAAELPDQPWTDLVAESGATPDRVEVISRLVPALDLACERFNRVGFAGFSESFAGLDALSGRQVRATDAAGKVLSGIARGVDAGGRLVLESGRDRLLLDHSEVSIRAE